MIYENLFKRYIPSFELIFISFLIIVIYIYKEGVLAAKMDFNALKHEELDVKVIRALQSLSYKRLCKDPVLVAMGLLYVYIRGCRVLS